MIFTRSSIASIFLCTAVLSTDIASADGLSAASPRRLLVDNAVRNGLPRRLTATPTPLAPGVFVFPFYTEEVVGGGFGGFTYFHRVSLSVPLLRIFDATGEPLFFAQPLATYATNGGTLDVAALSDSRFVVSGLVVPESGDAQLRAQRTVGNPGALEEQHIANVGYLIGTPPPAGGLPTASAARRVFVTWRLNRAGGLYDLFGQALLASP